MGAAAAAVVAVAAAAPPAFAAHTSGIGRLSICAYWWGGVRVCPAWCKLSDLQHTSSWVGGFCVVVVFFVCGASFDSVKNHRNTCPTFLVSCSFAVFAADTTTAFGRWHYCVACRQVRRGRSRSYQEGESKSGNGAWLLFGALSGVPTFPWCCLGDSSNLATLT